MKQRLMARWPRRRREGDSHRFVATLRPSLAAAPAWRPDGIALSASCVEPPAAPIRRARFSESARVIQVAKLARCVSRASARGRTLRLGRDPPPQPPTSASRRHAERRRGGLRGGAPRASAVTQRIGSETRGRQPDRRASRRRPTRAPTSPARGDIRRTIGDLGEGALARYDGGAPRACRSRRELARPSGRLASRSRSIDPTSTLPVAASSWARCESPYVTTEPSVLHDPADVLLEKIPVGASPCQSSPKSDRADAELAGESPTSRREAARRCA